MKRRPARFSSALVGLAVTTVAGSELLHWRASRSGAKRISTTGSTAIIVLGFRSLPSGRAHPVQRWRVKIAHRSATADGPGLIVFTGGPRTGGRTEAEAMAELSRTLGPTGYGIAIENRSLSTWENVLLALPMAEHCDTVVFASDPIHSARARAYARRQRPDLVDRIMVGDDYRLLERWWLKVPTVAYELWRTARHQVTGGT